MLANSVERLDHNRITPTARVVAYLRSFSDIPYATEISIALRGEEAARQLYGDDLDVATKLFAPLAEARYRCFSGIIDAYSNVLELAVGTSVERGLSISADPSKIYVGTDLPSMITELDHFLTKLIPSRRTNLFLKAANVLSYTELQAAAAHFGSRKEVLIIFEGLWIYLTPEEKTICAKNIRAILECYGGEWATPDIDDRTSREQFLCSLHTEMRSAIRRISHRVEALTERDFSKNLCFATGDDSVEFFERNGFAVREYPMVKNVACLSSAVRLWDGADVEIYEPLLGRSKVRVLSLR